MALIDDLRKRREAQSAPEPKKSISQEIGENMPALNSSPLDPLRAAGEGIMSIIPGAKAAEAKILGALPGNSEQKVAQQQAKLGKENEFEHGLGQAAGVAGAMALPGGQAAAGTLAGAAASAAEGAMLAPAYKLGDVANQAQIKGDALHVEQIANAFDFHDIAWASGLAAVMHVPVAGLEALAGAAQPLAQRAAKSAGDLFTKAAEKLGLDTATVGRMILDKGVLENAGALKRLTRDAGKRMEAGENAAQVDSVFRGDLADKLEELVKTQITPAAGMDAQARDLLKRAKTIRNNAEMDGGALGEIITSFGEEAKASNKSAVKELYRTAQQTFRDALGTHLDAVDPAIASTYRSAVQDYRTYSVLKQEAPAALKKQLSGADIAKTAGTLATTHVAGAVLGAPGAAGLAADAIIGGQSVRRLIGKSPARLLNKASKALPTDLFDSNVGQVLQSLVKGAPLVTALGADHLTADEIDDQYRQVTRGLRHSLQDTQGTSTKLRAHLGFLPPVQADSVTANSMNKLQAAAMDIPLPGGPATLFGSQVDVSDRQKREFLRRTDAKFSPFTAIASGRSDLVKHAEQYNPETVHEIKKRVVEHLANSPEVDFQTKRRVSGILGVPGTPTQDPRLGGTLQAIIAARKQANSAAGQMGSARNAKAAMKNDQSTLTRAQSILNDTGGGK